MTWETVFYIGLAAATITVVTFVINRVVALWEFIKAVKRRDMGKYLLLSFADALFGPSLAIAPRCERCNRITYDLEPCAVKHPNPAYDGRCGMARCRRCNRQGEK